MNTITAALAAAAFVAPIAAADNMTYISDNRLIVGFGAQTDLAGHTTSNTSQQHPDTPFADWSDATAQGVSNALGFATMDSTLNTTTIDAVGFASAGGFLPADTFASISALGASIHSISFSISNTTTFALNANLRASDAGESFIRLTNAPISGGDTIYEFRNINNIIDIQQQLTLSAGQYTLTFQAQSGDQLNSPGQIDGTARYDATWTIIPAPGTPLLTAFGCLTLARRRREQP